MVPFPPAPASSLLMSYNEAGGQAVVTRLSSLNTPTFMEAGMSDNQSIEYRAIAGFPGYRVGSDGSVWSQRARNGRRKPWQRLQSIWHHHDYRVVALFPGRCVR